MAYGRNFFYIRSEMSGLVVDIEGASTDPGTKVVMWSKGDGDADNQLWYFHRSTYTIRTRLNDFCLDFDGDRIVVNPYDAGNRNQRWKITNDNTIRNMYSKTKVLDIVGESSDEGAEICSWDYHGGSNQKFLVDTVDIDTYRDSDYTSDSSSDDDDDFAAGNYGARARPGVPFYLRSKLGHVLDIEGADPNPGANLCTWPKKDADEHPDNQLFYLDHHSGTVRSMLNHYCLDNAGGNLVMNPYDGEQGQRWKTSKKHFVRNLDDPRLVFDVEGGSSDEGAHVLAYPFHGGENQKFDPEYIFSDSDDEDSIGRRDRRHKRRAGNYFVMKCTQTGHVLDIQGGNSDPGAHLIMWGEHGGDNQQFTFHHKSRTIRSKMNDFCLDLDDDNGFVLNPYEEGKGSQKWKFTERGTIRNIYNKQQVFDVEGASEDEGARVLAYDWHGGPNQKFMVEFL